MAYARAWVIAMAIALGVTLFIFGLFLLIWAFRVFTTGSSILGMPIFGVLIGGFGCFMIGMAYIAISMVFAERRRAQERIVVLGAAAVGATVLFFGFFFFLAGALSIYFGIGGRPAGIEIYALIFGALVFAAGAYIVSELVELVEKRKRMRARR